MPHLKNSSLSLLYLGLSVLAYALLAQAFGGFVLMEMMEKDFFTKLDADIFWNLHQATGYSWPSASLDVAMFVTWATPTALLALSIFFGAKALKSAFLRSSKPTKLES